MTCGCGCGEKTKIVRGQPNRYVVGHNARVITRQPEDRFWAKVNRGAPDACWEWLGVRGQRGHGRFYLNPRQPTIPAHRAALIFTGIEVPQGATVCHHCDNPPCVNPAHLFVGTQLDNVRDMIAKGRSRAGEHQRQRTRCPKLHPYNEANTLIRPDGARACRACAREATRKRRAQLVLLGLNETPVEDTPLFDRACLAWLDKSTEWDAS